MAKGKRTKRQAMVYITLLRKLKIAQLKATKNRVNSGAPERVGSSCSTSGTRRVALVTIQ